MSNKLNFNNLRLKNKSLKAELQEIKKENKKLKVEVVNLVDERDKAKFGLNRWHNHFIKARLELGELEAKLKNNKFKQFPYYLAVLTLGVCIGYFVLDK